LAFLFLPQIAAAEPQMSALERLIAANQDFELLRVEEADDRSAVPAWLRVLWRKSHPAGPYPLLLKEIHEWMVSHPSLERAEREADVSPFTVTVFPYLRPNLRISGPAPNPRSETDIQVFELDPRRIVAASNNIEGSGRQAQYWSADGGASWGQTTLELVPRYARISKRLKSMTIWVDPEVFFPTRMQYVEADGDTTSYEFRDLKKNAPIPAERFALTLPKDVKTRTIDLGEGKEPKSRP